MKIFAFFLPLLAIACAAEQLRKEPQAQDEINGLILRRLDEIQAFNKELQASNRELQASNRELQEQVAAFHQASSHRMLSLQTDFKRVIHEELKDFEKSHTVPEDILEEVLAEEEAKEAQEEGEEKAEEEQEEGEEEAKEEQEEGEDSKGGGRRELGSKLESGAWCTTHPLYAYNYKSGNTSALKPYFKRTLYVRGCQNCPKGHGKILEVHADQVIASVPRKGGSKKVARASLWFWSKCY